MNISSFNIIQVEVISFMSSNCTNLVGLVNLFPFNKNIRFSFYYFKFLNIKRIKMTYLFLIINSY